MKRVFKRVLAKLPKRLTAAIAVAIAVALPVASLSAAPVRLEGTMGVANVTAGDTQYKDAVNASYDQVVKIQVYYHNREDPDSGKVAENLRVKVAIPTTPGKTQVVNGTLSATNANTVQDSVTVNLDRADAYLEYIPGSAVWKHNKGTNENVQIVEEKISDEIVYGGQGLLVENAKPCFNFDATITVLARVRVPGVQINKTVRVKGASTWSTLNTAKPEQTLEYQIAYKNTGNTTHQNVVIRDNLPPQMQYVPGSAKLKNDGGVKTVADGVTAGGIDIGTYGPGAAAYVLFEVKVPKSQDLACGVTEFRNVGVVRPKGMNEFYNTAVTQVTKDCEEQPELKQPVCDGLELTKLGGRKIRATVSYTKNDATFKDVTFNFGDGSTPLTTDKTSVEYTYAADSQYTVSTTLRFTLNGKEVVVNSNNCADSVNFTTPEVPGQDVQGKQTPEALPSTGPGEVAGIFAATTLAGAVAHRVVWSRRNR